MVYVDHSSCIKPDLNTPIWRYMDFTKFLSLLERRELFFSTIGILRQSDKHEGTYNQATIDAIHQNRLPFHDIHSPLLHRFGHFVAANCWHMGLIESVAMWDVFLGGKEGVAIKTSFQKLIDSFAVSLKHQVLIGQVHYLSETDTIPQPSGPNGLNACLWKWNSYQYEQELRALVIALQEDLYKYNGVYVPVDLDTLIEQIIISPKAPGWFSELITSMASKYGIDQKIAPSILSSKPGNLDAGKKLSIEVCSDPIALDIKSGLVISRQPVPPVVLPTALQIRLA